MMSLVQVWNWGFLEHSDGVRLLALESLLRAWGKNDGTKLLVSSFLAKFFKLHVAKFWFLSFLSVFESEWNNVFLLWRNHLFQILDLFLCVLLLFLESLSFLLVILSHFVKIKFKVWLIRALKIFLIHFQLVLVYKFVHLSYFLKMIDSVFV